MLKDFLYFSHFIYPQAQKLKRIPEGRRGGRRVSTSSSLHNTDGFPFKCSNHFLIIDLYNCPMPIFNLCPGSSSSLLPQRVRAPAMSLHQSVLKIFPFDN